VAAARATSGTLDGEAMPELVEWRDSQIGHLRELVRHRELLWMVTRREITVRYRQTILGALWAVLQPLSLMVVLTVFFAHFLVVRSDDIPYPLFSYAGLLPWTFFATSLAFAVPSLISNSHLITRIYFPREIIALASVLAALVDFGIAAVIFLALLAAYGVPLTWTALYVAPLLLVQVTFTTACCLFLSGLTVLYRDIRFTVPLLVQVWMFATPVLYPLSAVPEHLRTAYLALNPMAAIIDGYRRAVLQGQPPDLPHLALVAGISLALLLLAYRCFKHLERQFADII
jgi:lipopolysaccharide transport system permease protein